MQFHSGLSRPPKKGGENHLMALWVCMWCVLVYFISNISKPPSFKTLRLHMNKSKSLLLPALPHLLRSTLQPDCLGQRGSLGTPQTTHWCPDSRHSSSLVLCKTRVGSHSMSVTHLPDWFYCFLKLIGHENKVCSIEVNTRSGNSLKPAC